MADLFPLLAPFQWGEEGLYFAEGNCKIVCLRDTFELSALDCICSLHMFDVNICWKTKLEDFV